VTLALTLFACGTPLDQPEPMVFDHVACDHCGMLVSDPRFAAQLVTREGDRYQFDDPACVFQHIVDHGGSLGHVWFHDSAGEGWLDHRQVGFVPASGAPMDGGLAAVPLATEEAWTFAEASARLLGGAR
jgi:copper chaperone NosL